MINSNNLVLEKFEIPAELQNQLENTGYSALGHILTSHIAKKKEDSYKNHSITNKSYNDIKNIVDNVTKLIHSTGNNTLKLENILVPEYYSIQKSHIKKVSITIEKQGDDIYINSNEKTDKLFPNIVIYKDYAGWNIKELEKYWKEIDGSYKQYTKTFEENIVYVENLFKKVSKWKNLDKARKPKIHPDNQKMSLVYEKTIPSSGKRYDHYFRVMPSRTVDSYDSPHHFAGAMLPYIVQTVYLDEFSVDSQFMRYVDYFIETSRHEGRHLIQHYKDVEKNLPRGQYGGPKKTLKHQYKKDVRGIDPHGTSTTNSPNAEPNDRWGRVLHPFRDVEFKTNLYHYKHEINNFLTNNLPVNKWKEGFKDVLLHIIGKGNNTDFRKKYKSADVYRISNSVTKNHLDLLYKHDKEKFNQIIKELYKLIFNP